MSYVLDALRKAEGERRKTEKPDVDSFDETLWSKPPELTQDSNNWRMATFFLLAVVLFVLLLLGIGAQQFPQDYDSPQKQPAIVIEPVAAVSSAPVTSSVTEASLLELPVQQPELKELPAPTAGEISANSEIRLEGVIFINASSTANRALIDGGMYRAGDLIRPGLLLVDIFEQGVIVTQGQEQLELFIK